MPEGWTVDAMIARVVAAGACTYRDLVDGSLDLYDFFSALRVVDWIDYTRQLASSKD